MIESTDIRVQIQKIIDCVCRGKDLEFMLEPKLNRYGTHQQTGPHLYDVLHFAKELCTHCIVYGTDMGDRGDKFLLTHA